MVENENKNVDINSPDTANIENLKLIFSISDNLKNEMSKVASENSNKIYNMLNMILLLTGIYITLLIFVYDHQQDKNLLFAKPILFSFLFLVAAIIRSLSEIFPAPSLPITLPKKIYKLTNNTSYQSLKLLIPTYLDSVNKMWLVSAENSFSRQQIVLLLLMFVLNFIFFGVYAISDSYKMYVDILSIIFTIGFLIFYCWFIKSRRAKLTKLKDKLENENK